MTQQPFPPGPVDQEGLDASIRETIRIQFARAAELAARPADDAYAARWSAIHERIAEVAARRLTDR